MRGHEVRVFEKAEHREVDSDGDAERPFPARLDVAVDHDRRDVIEDDGEQQDQQEARLAPGVEDEREKSVTTFLPTTVGVRT